MIPVDGGPREYRCCGRCYGEGDSGLVRGRHLACRDVYNLKAVISPSKRPRCHTKRNWADSAVIWYP